MTTGEFVDDPLRDDRCKDFGGLNSRQPRAARLGEGDRYGKVARIGEREVV
jgi:hypothetical protein